MFGGWKSYERASPSRRIWQEALMLHGFFISTDVPLYRARPDPASTSKGQRGTHDARGPPPKIPSRRRSSHDSRPTTSDKGCSRPPRRNNSETARHNKGCGRDQYHANSKTSSFYLLTNVKLSRRKRQREANDRRCMRALRSRIQRDSTFPFGP